MTQPNLMLYSFGLEPDIIDKLLNLINENEELKEKRIKDKHIISKPFIHFELYAKEIMEKRYDKLVESVGFLKHPISNVLYRAIAAESTSIVIETPTDYQIQKKLLFW
ncbi:hypothetical protein ACTFIT_009386 [Dictyostelium discoideum]